MGTKINFIDPSKTCKYEYLEPGDSCFFNGELYLVTDEKSKMEFYFDSHMYLAVNLSNGKIFNFVDGTEVVPIDIEITTKYR